MPLAGGLYFHLSQESLMETPPVVLLHGVGGGHLFWPAQIRRLVGYRIFALDLPGHGKSDQGGGLQTIEAYARQVVEWMDAIHLHRAVFVGHDLGGAIALTLSAQYPERVLGMGLLSTGMRLSVPQDLLADATNPATFYKAVEKLAGWFFGVPIPGNLFDFVSNALREVRPSVLYGDLLAWDRFDCTEKLAEIQAPTLILCGDEDQVTPLRTSQLLAQILPRANLKVIPQAGHMIMLEQPEQVANLLIDFLKQIPYLAGEVNRYVPGN